MAVSGMDLKLERIRARLTVSEMAERMRRSRTTIWTIEKSADVSDDQAELYRAALLPDRDVETVA